MSNETETVTISKSEYVKLKGDSDFLSALFAAGVDSWEGYEQAQEAMQDDTD